MRKRDVSILVLALVLALGGVVLFFRGQALEPGSWGLSFRQEGTAPIGNADAAHLARYDGAYLGNTQE